MAAYSVRLGDCIECLKSVPDNSIDSIVTDPPYGLSKQPRMDEVLRHWLAGDDYKHHGSGFVGKSWDSFVPGPSVWKEAIRCLKPGGWAVIFAGSRTQDLMGLSLRLAGFEIMDTGMWLYGSGFPKSLDISKAIDAQDAAKRWQGWGTALKPAYEPFILCRKPLDGTYANNVLTHGCGVLNIDGCRVLDGTETGRDKPEYRPNAANDVYGSNMGGGAWENTSGRWPANVITTDLGEPWAKYFYCAKASKRDRDEGLEHLALTDSAELVNRNPDSKGMNSPRAGAGRSSGRRNIHPTVKPTDLMAYLCRLVTPPQGLVLDPFMGSGSTGKAAMREGFSFVGIERDPTYLAIADARIHGEWQNQGWDLV